MRQEPACLNVIDKSEWEKTRPALCSHLPQSRIASQVAPQNHITPDIVLAHITLRSSIDSCCDEDESAQKAVKIESHHNYEDTKQ